MKKYYYSFKRFSNMMDLNDWMLIGHVTIISICFDKGEHIVYYRGEL